MQALTLLRKSTSWIFGLFLLGAAFFLYADANAEEPQASPKDSVHTKRVLAGEVRSADATRKARFPGVTRSAKRARLAFLLGGRLMSRPVEIGDRVRAGQELARLDDRELRLGVDATRAAADELIARRTQAERDVERARRLVEAKAATPEELERIQAGLDGLRAGEESAAARIRNAERQLGEARLLAPFDGVITNVLQEPGEMVAPGTPVILLSGEAGLEVEIEVPASIVFSLQEGDTAEIKILALDLHTPATLLSVGRTAAGPGSLFPVVLRLSASELADRLMPGMSAEAVLQLAEAEGLSVPIEAVVNPGGQRPTVFRITSADGVSRVQKVRIEVGELLGDHVLIRGDDLSTGDQIVIGGQRGLLDGDAVLVGAAGAAISGEVND